MLRRRPPSAGSPQTGDPDDPPHKQPSKKTKAKNVSLRACATTLYSAVLSAISPLQDVRSQAYSEYLTSQVQSLTFGWHIFRTVTEGAFLASYGLAFNTLVVQIFWSFSLASVLLYGARHDVWLAWREAICVATNCAYGLITVAKIWHLVPRLPNENHYMFKHCFLTMADAAFSQTPVHKQYLIQFAEAVIRVVVWRRYNVLADTPTWGVIAISLAWQVWLLTFSSMLQARHVTGFRQRQQRQLQAPSSGGGGSASARSSLSATASRPASCEIEPAHSGGGASTSAAAAAAGLRVVLRPHRSPRGSIGAVTAVTYRGGGDGGSSGATPSTTAAAASGGSAAQRRFMRALRAVARSPSSYVLLSHKRRQSGGPQSASVQFYIPSANPEMLSGNWRDRLAGAVAEGAPGWQVAAVCVRKGSLIVHLDLVYVPPAATAGTGKAGDPAAAAVASAVAASGGGECTGDGYLPAGLGMTYSEQPFDAAAAAAPYSPKEALNDYMGGMDAESLLQLLGLTPDLPTPALACTDGAALHQQHHHRNPAPISLQMGDQLRDLPFATPANVAAAAVPPSSPLDLDLGLSPEDLGALDLRELGLGQGQGDRSRHRDHHLPDRGEGGEAQDTDGTAAAEPMLPPCTAEAIVTAKTASTPSVSEARVCGSAAAAPVRTAWRRLVAVPARVALLPPTELRSAEYVCFLSARVGSLHIAYAAFICLTALALLVLHSGGAGVNPLTLLMFTGAEVATLLSVAVLGGVRSAAWRGARCGVVYAGVLARTLQMAACTSGVLPHLLRDSDCTSGRWIQKVLLITTLQALCMQAPVRTLFLVRVPSVLVSLYIHVFVCRTHVAVGRAAALHLGWEALLFLISANFQCRHLEAFRRRLKMKQRKGGLQQQEEEEEEEKRVAEQKREPLLTAAAAAVTSAPPCDDKRQHVRANGGEEGVAAANAATVAAAAAVAAPASPLEAAKPVPATYGFVPAAADGDPFDISLSAPLVAMAPRRAAQLQLLFACAPAVVEELQVVLRHINPAAMAAGVHSAHAVRDITRALVAPAGAADAGAAAPVSFAAELTLVASPADMPGLVHVELWRGRRRVASHPVLLAAAATAATDAAAGASGNWLEDVRMYVEGLREQGHGAAADQFVEELGCWLAQAAALQRGLTVAAAGPGGGGGGLGAAASVANVLYFHGYGSEFMYVKPRRASGAGGGGAVAGGDVASDDPLHGTLRRLLQVQGALLLAVAVEAGCVALAEHLVGLMVGELGATLGGLLDTARTPVSQLPLLHAAVKSGEPRMVDLVAEWSARCGLKDIWAAEAAILAVSLDVSCASSAAGDSTRTGTRASVAIAVTNTPSVEAAAVVAAAVHGTGTGFVAAAQSRLSRSPLMPAAPADPPDPTGVCLRGAETAGAQICGVAPHAGQCLHTSAAAAAAAAEYDEGAVITAMDGAATASGDFDPDAFLTDSEADLAEASPFRIINFRASNRVAAAASGPAASPDIAVWTAAAAPIPPASGDGAAVDGGGVSRSIIIGGGGGGGGVRLSRERGRSLVDSGVVVLTPLLMSLALGDEGRLASHILSTYPEAYDLWRSSQLDGQLDSSASLAAADAGRCDGRCVPSEGGPSCTASSLGMAPPSPSHLLMVGASDSSQLLLGPTAAAAAGACSSMPGLMCRSSVLGGGMGSRDDSMGGVSRLSVNLSEVAFLEGIRWVDEAGTSRRPAFKVTRA